MNISKNIADIYLKKDKKSKCLIALLLTICLFVFCYIFMLVSYYTLDDWYISQTLEIPYYWQTYIHPILSGSVYLLCKYFPFKTLQWWFVFSQIVLFIGVYLVHYYMMFLATKNTLFINILSIIAVDIFFFVEFISRTAFTVTPAILVAGLIMCILVDEDISKAKQFFCFIGFLIAFSMRKESGYVLFCYFALAVIYKVANKHGVLSAEQIKKSCFYLAILGIALCTLIYVDNIVNERIHDGNEFKEFNSARILFIDYNHDSYEDNPQLYDDIGWDYEVYRNASNWSFLPREITTDDFLNIYEAGREKTGLVEVFANLRAYVSRYNSIFVFAIVSLVGAISAKRKTTDILLLLFNNLGCISLLLYLSWHGRAPYRALVVVLLPAIIINLFIALNNEEKGIKNKIVIAFMALIIGAGIKNNWCMIATPDARYIKKMQYDDISRLSQYVGEHSDNLYLYSQALTTDGIKKNVIYPENMIPTNRTMWCAEKKVREDYDIGSIDWESVRRENVFVVGRYNVCKEGLNINQDFSQALYGYLYLKSRTNILGFVDVDHVEGTATSDFTIYDYVFEDNKDKYDHWYYIDDDVIYRYDK